MDCSKNFGNQGALGIRGITRVACASSLLFRVCDVSGVISGLGFRGFSCFRCLGVSGFRVVQKKS